MTHLDVGQDELGRLFGVSGETVRRWERGKSSISSGSEAAILAVESAVRRLLEIFCRDRLPLAIRRKAKLFNGETALEWILRGRIEQVVESYERTLLYQA
jgi:transcriptional regulator with XRE-family HTH domain